MKLLYDENLSPKLVQLLADVFPGSAHVDRTGLGGSGDYEVWRYAKDNDFTLVSKDSDFFDLIALRGHPPKLIWIRRGNCSNRQIQLLLRNKADEINEMLMNDEIGFITID